MKFYLSIDHELALLCHLLTKWRVIVAR